MYNTQEMNSFINENKALFDRYLNHINYQVYGIEVNDARNSFIINFLEAAQVSADWQADIDSLLYKSVDATKRTLAHDYSEGGIVMSYTTRRRHSTQGKSLKVSSITYDNEDGESEYIPELKSEYSFEDKLVNEEMRNLLTNALEIGSQCLNSEDLYVVMARVNGKSFPEIAAELGKTSGALRVQYSRTINKLKDICLSLDPEALEYIV